MAIFYAEANGTPFGEYQAEDKPAAIVAVARDAGYASLQDVPGGMDDVFVSRVDTAAIVAAVEAATGKPVFDDAYGSGAAYFDGRPYETWDHLASVIGDRVWEYLEDWL